IVRAIGDPEVRLREDPVRMLRAVALASRLDFTVDPPVLDAIRKHRHEIAHSSRPRVLEEYFKILRAGGAEKSFRWLADLGVLEPISAELHHGATDRLWQSPADLARNPWRFVRRGRALEDPVGRRPVSRIAGGAQRKRDRETSVQTAPPQTPPIPARPFARRTGGVHLQADPRAGWSRFP